MRKVIILDYNSRYYKDLEKSICIYNRIFPDNAFLIQTHIYDNCLSESLAGPADLIIHSGGEGEPVKEDSVGIPKFYICHSHQWKAKKEGGKVIKLGVLIQGVREIDIIEDDEIMGKRGKMLIMKYHELALIEPPRNGKVIATSRVRDGSGREIEIIEAIRYSDDSLSVQGHPEEGTAVRIIYNIFERIRRKTGIEVK